MKKITTNDIIEQTGKDIDKAAVAEHVAAKQGQLADAIAASNDAHERAAIMAPLTAERIDDAMDTAMAAMVGLFFDPEERVLADNGKAYPVTFDFEGRDYDSTGELVTVDANAFINRQVASIVPRGLEYLLDSQRKAIAKQRNSIQETIRFGRNAGTDVELQLDRQTDFLAKMVEQEALLNVAYTRACERYAAATGEAYLDKQAKERAAKERASAVTEDRLARLAKLGVTLNS